ncbi:hypothetical protein [Spirosoma endophyticum]|uniref:Uncharacterized protein n=1 Tax=Spirosoma endophyticum TaxID=662367 RepID=A0A1I2GXE6_9BACT|nr:hypothetical protein [Spirosoma endophyticum]SFF22092.1 hypothetical protein SAMN05216167_13623 [Spirosoma endophyticum]
MISKPILTLDPTDPRHRRLIAAAIKAKDTAALSKLKGNTQKPIGFINSWFFYGLIPWEIEAERSHVPIYSPRPGWILPALPAGARAKKTTRHRSLMNWAFP